MHTKYFANKIKSPIIRPQGIEAGHGSSSKGVQFCCHSIIIYTHFMFDVCTNVCTNTHKKISPGTPLVHPGPCLYLYVMINLALIAGFLHSLQLADTFPTLPLLPPPAKPGSRSCTVLAIHIARSGALHELTRMLFSHSFLAPPCCVDAGIGSRRANL